MSKNVNLASPRLGSQAILCSDDFFAAKDGLAPQMYDAIQKNKCGNRCVVDENASDEQLAEQAQVLAEQLGGLGPALGRVAHAVDLPHAQVGPAPAGFALHFVECDPCEFRLALDTREQAAQYAPGPDLQIPTRAARTQFPDHIRKANG